MNSVLQNDKYCWFCGTTYGLHEHHIFEGTKGRNLSEKYGMKVYICAYHHNLGGKNCVHENREMALKLKVYAQQRFEELYPNENFLSIFGRNYL